MYGEVFILQRIIAYIYRYKGDGNIYRKCGNVGFCRVEDISGKRVINMCFKETHKVTKECQISDRESLCQILSLIECLHLKERINCSTTAYRRKFTLIKSLTVSIIDVCS